MVQDATAALMQREASASREMAAQMGKEALAMRVRLKEMREINNRMRATPAGQRP